MNAPVFSRVTIWRKYDRAISNALFIALHSAYNNRLNERTDEREEKCTLELQSTTRTIHARSREPGRIEPGNFPKSDVVIIDSV